MPARGTRARCLTGAGILLALAGSVGLAGAQARPAADSVAERVKKLVQGIQETVKGISKTLTEGATGVEQLAKAASAESRRAREKLERSAQGVGESIWDGMKSVGRLLQKFFTGSKGSLSHWGRY
jgi:methyl-accepting chemotaxis protein